MQTEPTKIGPIELSRIMDTLLPLIGVVIGGLITYLTTRALDGSLTGQVLRS